MIACEGHTTVDAVVILLCCDSGPFREFVIDSVDRRQIELWVMFACESYKLLTRTDRHLVNTILLVKLVFKCPFGGLICRTSIIFWLRQGDLI